MTIQEPSHANGLKRHVDRQGRVYRYRVLNDIWRGAAASIGGIFHGLVGFSAGEVSTVEQVFRGMPVRVASGNSHLIIAAASSRRFTHLRRKCGARDESSLEYPGNNDSDRSGWWSTRRPRGWAGAPTQAPHRFVRRSVVPRLNQSVSGFRFFALASRRLDGFRAFPRDGLVMVSSAPAQRKSPARRKAVRNLLRMIWGLPSKWR